MRIHAIVTAYGPDAYGLSSPQLPALFAGGVSVDEYRDDALVTLLMEAGAPAEFQLVVHRQQFFTRGEQEFFVRRHEDRNPAALLERLDTLHKLRDLFNAEPDAITDASRASTGESLFIVALRQDTVRWLSEQLDADGVATVVCQAGDDHLWLFNISTEGDPGDEPLDPDTTVGELLRTSSLHWTAQGSGIDFLTDDTTTAVNRAREVVLV